MPLHAPARPRPSPPPPAHAAPGHLADADHRPQLAGRCCRWPPSSAACRRRQPNLQRHVDRLVGVHVHGVNAARLARQHVQVAEGLRGGAGQGRVVQTSCALCCLALVARPQKQRQEAAGPHLVLHCCRRPIGTCRPPQGARPPCLQMAAVVGGGGWEAGVERDDQGGNCSGRGESCVQTGRLVAA